MITDEMLAEAVAEFNTAMLDALPNTSEGSHEFSDRFERKMKKVFHKGNHPVRYRIIQRVASFIIVLFLSFVILFAISPSVRATVIGWIREQIGDLLRYSYSNTEYQSSDSISYYAAYIPDGYAEIDKNVTPGRTVIHYKNRNTNQLMHFVYTNNYTSIMYYVDTAEYIRQDLEINGVHIDFYKPLKTEVATSIIWSDKKSDTFFFLSAYEEKGEIIKIYKNIKELQE